MVKAAVRQLQDLITPTIERLDYELLGCELLARRHRSLLRIFIDAPGGVKLDDCAKISRQISALLDVEDPIGGSYDLEVSSPGIERPLFTAEHYQQYIGHGAKLRLRAPREGQRNFKGVISAVEGASITLQLGEELLTLSLSEIERGHLIPDL